MESEKVVCAVCKHQAKLCGANCCFARHFLSNKSEEFIDVKHHFGIKNFTKLVAKVSDHRKDDAIKSMIYEAKIRRVNPIEGTLAVKAELQDKVRKTIEELVRVEAKLKSLRSTQTLITAPPSVDNNDPAMDMSTDCKEGCSKEKGSSSK